MAGTRNNRKSNKRNNRKSNRKQQQNRKQNGGGYYNDLEAAPIGLRPVVASYDDNNPPAPKLTGGRRRFKGGNNTKPTLEQKMKTINDYINKNKNPLNVLTNLFKSDKNKSVEDKSVEKVVEDKVDELYNLVLEAEARAAAQELAPVAAEAETATETVTTKQELAPVEAQVAPAAKGGSKNKQRRQRKQQGGHNENAQFGCRQPEWTPDCR